MSTIAPEKIPDGPRSVVYSGVAIVSRYGQCDELETVMRAIDHVADHEPSFLRSIASIFSDSKVSGSYTIAVDRQHGPGTWAAAIALCHALDRAFRAAGSSYHDLYVQTWAKREVS